MSNVINLFEKASRLRVRFDSAKGQVSVEDLWSLPLAQLDQIAQALDTKINSGAKKSYITKATTVSELDQFRLDLLVYIINTRLAEHEEKQLERQKAERKAFLLDLLADREKEKDQAMTTDDIMKELQAL